MYIIAIIIFIICVCLVTGLSIGQLAFLLDIPSLICILFLTVPVLAASGLFKDLCKGFGIAFRKTETHDVKQLKRSVEAVGLAEKLCLYSGVLTTLIGAVVLLMRLDDAAALGPNLAVCILTLMYAVILAMILRPLRVRLKLQLGECEQSES